MTLQKMAKILTSMLIALNIMKLVTKWRQEKTVSQNNIIEGEARNFKEEAKKLKFIHIRSQFDQDIATTIGYMYDRRLKLVYYEVARCSHGDKFCKRIGREIAKGRYAKYGPSYTLDHVASDADMYEQLEILWHPDMHVNFELEGEVA